MLVPNLDIIRGENGRGGQENIFVPSTPSQKI